MSATASTAAASADSRRPTASAAGPGAAVARRRRLARAVRAPARLERRVLAQDRLLELAQLRPRLDPELVDERARARR